jgi:hypothetical protein
VTSSQDAGPASAASLSSVNAVFALSLILTQAPSATRAMRLVTTAVPSIAPGHTAVAWHPSTAGDYYERAPVGAGRALALFTAPGRLDLPGVASSWAFPLTAPHGREPVFLVTAGPEDLSGQEIFLLSVLAQMCGTVIANHELQAEAELRAKADRERDIARARAAELAVSESRQRAVLEAALDAVVIIDGQARVTYVNLLGLIAEGRSNSGIAAELVVTVAAVERHVTSIFDKLGLRQSRDDHRRVLAVLTYLQA